VRLPPGAKTEEKTRKKNSGCKIGRGKPAGEGSKQFTPKNLAGVAKFGKIVHSLTTLVFPFPDRAAGLRLDY